MNTPFYSGSWTRLIRNSLSREYAVYAFDSFIGLPEDWVGTPCSKGTFSTGKKPPDINNVNFVVGWFEETLPEFVRTHKAEPACLIHIDCDLYSSTKTVLGSVGEFITSGTVIVFNEWIYNHDYRCNDHEQKAFLEWSEENEVAFKIVKFKNETSCGDERKIVQII